MTDLLVTATLGAASGIPADAVQNSFAFKSDVAITPSVVLDIHNAVTDFYNGTTVGQVRPVASYLSSALSRATGAVSLKMYDITGSLDGSPHGSPIAQDAVTLGAAGAGVSHIPQAAICVTLRGRDALEQPVEGALGIRPRQRRTGRIYLGPLNVLSSDAGHPPRVHIDCRKDINFACERLQDSLVDADYIWAVWSRTTQTLRGIERTEVDDSFDVIRSRKVRPSVRNQVTFTPEPSLVLGA